MKKFATNGPNLIFRKAKMAGKSVEKYAAKKLQIPDVRGEALFGIHSSLEAIRAGKREIHQIFVKKNFREKAVKDERIHEILEKCQKLSLKLEELTADQLDRLTEYQLHNGICMDVSRLDFTNYQPKNVSIYLDKVLDPGNLGAIGRSAWFFGADGISFGNKRGPKTITPSMSKSSCGALEHLPVQKLSGFWEYRELIKNSGGELIATCDANAAHRKNLKTLKLTEWMVEKPVGLILGDEGCGIDENLLTFCDKIVTIDSARSEMSNVTSLNVSVVAAILLNHIANFKKF